MNKNNELCGQLLLVYFSTTSISYERDRPREKAAISTTATLRLSLSYGNFPVPEGIVPNTLRLHHHAPRVAL